MKTILTTLLITLFLSTNVTNGQEKYQTQNVVLVTLDGYRWQEVFQGIDSTLLYSNFTRNKAELEEKYWKSTTIERSIALNPFFQGYVAKNGVLLGNRNIKSEVDCTNKMWFSYPGYNEILTGKADDKNIKSNDKIPNPNVTFLEVLNKTKGFKNGVAAFGSWDVFPYIVNEERSGVYVNAGFEKATHKKLSTTEVFLNKFQEEVSSPWTEVRLDAFTHRFAMEYMKNLKPRVTYIAYGETDDFAHDGNYTKYIESAYLANIFLMELWNFIQHDKFYANKTTLIVTTDHGRGTIPLESWKNHGSRVNGADQIWIAMIGPDTKNIGNTLKGKFRQSQIAPTIMKLLEVPFDSGEKPLELLIN
ncbi:MAG: phosphoglyceromutase [Cyclobacteriaceae bacterium]|nr:phosphoglyceromutase [Cyclobacteriaceae bacterium]